MRHGTKGRAMEVVMFVLYVLGGILLYLTPTILAANRHHPNTGMIAAINILTGWTFLGWVVAFIWSLAAVPKPEQS
jgi:Superinfection immunity protein